MKASLVFAGMLVLLMWGAVGLLGFVVSQTHALPAIHVFTAAR